MVRLRLLAGAIVSASVFASTLTLAPAGAHAIVLPHSQVVIPNDGEGGGSCNHQGEGGGGDVQSAYAQRIDPQDDGNGHPVRVHPCHVLLTTSNPGPQSVTVRYPNTGGTLVELDNCAARGIATITPAGSNQYQVTAGANMGTCQAIFQYFNRYGKKVGQARLFINNQV